MPGGGIGSSKYVDSVVAAVTKRPTARAGTNHIYGFGDDPGQLKDFSWYEDNSDFEPHEVATKNPNPWGLYDMLGNVQEWVHDFYSPTAYEQQIKQGPTSGKVYVTRGGYYDSTPAEVRCAAW